MSAHPQLNSVFVFFPCNNLLQLLHGKLLGRRMLKAPLRPALPYILHMLREVSLTLFNMIMINSDGKWSWLI